MSQTNNLFSNLFSEVSTTSLIGGKSLFDIDVKQNNTNPELKSICEEMAKKRSGIFNNASNLSNVRNRKTNSQNNTFTQENNLKNDSTQNNITKDNEESFTRERNNDSNYELKQEDKCNIVNKETKETINNNNSNTNLTYNTNNTNKPKEIENSNTNNAMNELINKAKVFGSDYIIEVNLNKSLNKIEIKLNHNIYFWKNLSKSFSNEELDKCNPIWNNHSLEQKCKVIKIFFFSKMKEENKEELSENASNSINISLKTIKIQFETGIIKNEITMKLEDYKLSFNDLKKAEKIYFNVKSKSVKTDQNITNISKFIEDYEYRINRLVSLSQSDILTNV